MQPTADRDTDPRLPDRRERGLMPGWVPPSGFGLAIFVLAEIACLVLLVRIL